ncbi:transposase family protein [Okeania sp. KiyG1]|uniref:transposase family protein n=1 Tax=Okeania sp. KiyG1 TaxID=2720165 RepID=UPI00272E81A2|nr:transposase family protein [Okeania sp. KiyG1]
MNQQQIIFFALWSDILRELLPSSLLEEFSGKENEYLWIKEALTEIELRVDSTEQDIFRPKNDEKQKKYYSVKPKSHTLKNQIVITSFGKRNS